MVVNYPIGWVVTHVVMALIFYLVVTPLGVIMRLCGRDPMERRWLDRRAKTYCGNRGPHGRRFRAAIFASSRRKCACRNGAFHTPLFVVSVHEPEPETVG